MTSSITALATWHCQWHSAALAFQKVLEAPIHVPRSLSHVLKRTFNGLPGLARGSGPWIWTKTTRPGYPLTRPRSTRNGPGQFLRPMTVRPNRSWYLILLDGSLLDLRPKGCSAHVRLPKPRGHTERDEPSLGPWSFGPSAMMAGNLIINIQPKLVGPWSELNIQPTTISIFIAFYPYYLAFHGIFKEILVLIWYIGSISLRSLQGGLHILLYSLVVWVCDFFDYCLTVFFPVWYW